MLYGVTTLTTDQRKQRSVTLQTLLLAPSSSCSYITQLTMFTPMCCVYITHGCKTLRLWNSATSASLCQSVLGAKPRDIRRIERDRCRHDRVLATSHRRARLGLSRQKWIAVLNHPVDENWKSGSKLSPSRPVSTDGECTLPCRDKTRRAPIRSAGWLNLENVIAFVDGNCAQTAYETRSLVSGRTYPPS